MDEPGRAANPAIPEDPRAETPVPDRPPGPCALAIGSVRVFPALVLAPLAGITNLPFRLLAREAGCGLVCSEMVSANGLVQGSGRTRHMLETCRAERPLSVQIFGADPEVMARAARIVAASGADVLDVNFGCSVKKVVKTGAGVALMRTPELAGSILRAMRDAVDLPLTVKIRSGWDRSGDQALRIAEIAQAAGVSAVTVHPRTASQGFSGCADWSLIRRVREHCDVPVIGNGDVTDPRDAVNLLVRTGCSAVMVGRAAIGAPWVFRRIAAHLLGRPDPEIPLAWRRDLMLRYVRETCAHLGGHQGPLTLRSRLGWFVKGLAHGGRFRESIKTLSSEAEAMDRVLAYFDGIRERPAAPQDPAAARALGRANAQA